jgi:hypothetical protein
MAIAIYEKAQGQRLFEINEEQLQALIDALEEEDVGDRDYYIDAAVCDFLEGRVDADVVARLRAALPPGARGGQTPAAEGDGADGAAAEAAEELDGEEAPSLDEDEDQGIEIEWRRE